MKLKGIYKIINKITGKFYIGSSSNIHVRWLNHKIELRNGTHKNSYLMNAWKKYGEKNFVFEIVKILPESSTTQDVQLEEQIHLDILKNNQKQCYNLCFDATGGELSEESRRKISIKNSGKNNGFFGKEHSNESLKIMRDKRKFRIGHLAPNFGKRHSLETLQLFRKQRLGKLNSAYNPKIYVLTNLKTDETVQDTMYNLRMKFSFNRKVLSELLHGKIKTYRGWVCSNPTL